MLTCGTSQMRRAGWIRLPTFGLSQKANLLYRGHEADTPLLVQGWFSVIASMEKIGLTKREKN